MENRLLNATLQRFFRVTAPTIHNMILTLESHGYIVRTPGKARSILILVPSNDLPALHEPAEGKVGGAT
jgi:hypothetical protein